MKKDKNILNEISVKRDYLNHQIAECIQKSIIRQQLQPGTRLPSERELAQSLGVNRATVGEAINILELQGLVRRKIGNGTFVINMPQSVVADTIERFYIFGSCTHEQFMVVREMIEPETAALAAIHASRADLKKMEE